MVYTIAMYIKPIHIKEGGSGFLKYLVYTKQYKTMYNMLLAMFST